jgi:hypothetical protein
VKRAPPHPPLSPARPSAPVCAVATAPPPTPGRRPLPRRRPGPTRAPPRATRTFATSPRPPAGRPACRTARSGRREPASASWRTSARPDRDPTESPYPQRSSNGEATLIKPAPTTLGLGALLLGAPAAPVRETAPGAGEGVLFVTLQGEDAVARLPDRARWPAGDTMTHATVSPDGSLVLATSSGESRVYAYDAASGDLCARLEFGPGGRVAIAANEGAGSVSFIDLDSLAVTRTLEAGAMPHNLLLPGRGDGLRDPAGGRRDRRDRPAGIGQDAGDPGEQGPPQRGREPGRRDPVRGRQRQGRPGRNRRRLGRGARAYP